uniref:Methyltransferase type 12 domain-containing protein n=1 Tax=Chromera velia CCMP2878 TaxID=1169474 RepID=A0A0G4GJK5_9ALVE|eukprot:Cvel_22192.t1-p1 / transcript=Cvel_22192.t1 / gene=Cvel_22192 / organism=Chromera_velia_CCMP2878 / gene_product=hypothetical protein / transcript_product=hypothetical protein / location=Cvel_scaffold2155:26167-27541(-) / protein_length=322 / sequence_SO=supercontig / SO=protein_coding / is_pseudo=false
MAEMSQELQHGVDYSHLLNDSNKATDVKEIYAKWARSYDEDVKGSSASGTIYVGSERAAQCLAKTLRQCLESSSGTGFKGGLCGLDVGCGTGLSGQAVVEAVREEGILLSAVDGLDISRPMLEEARKKSVYRDLLEEDITQSDWAEGKKGGETGYEYDFIFSSGTFTSGHVGPDPAIRNLLAVLKPGGILAFTVGRTWRAHSYPSFLEELVGAREEGGRKRQAGAVQCEVLSAERIQYYIHTKSSALPAQTTGSSPLEIQTGVTPDSLKTGANSLEGGESNEMGKGGCMGTSVQGVGQEEEEGEEEGDYPSFGRVVILQRTC